MSLSASQRQAVASFRDMYDLLAKSADNRTNCTDASAQRYLKAARYNIEVAVDTYFRKHTGQAKVDTKQIEKIFNTYADDTKKDEIQIEGTMRYLEDLGMDLEEIGVLALAMELSAPTQGIFDRSGFVKGWQSLGISDLKGMKEHAATLTPALKAGNSDLFKRTYLNTFSFALTPPSRTLPLETALVFWDLLLADTFTRLKQWKEFLTEKGKGVSRDTWNLLLDFSQTVKDDLSDYDETEAWPVVIDEFVAWSKARQ